MKILLACQQSDKTYPIPAYGFWRRYFHAGLTEAGHEIGEVAGADWALGLMPLDDAGRRQWLAETWTRTLDAVREAARTRPFDVFLSYLYPDQVDPAAIREIRALGVPCVNFFCDNVREFRRVPPAYQPFDLHWVPEAAARPMYAAAGFPVFAAPMPCWVPLAARTGTEMTEETLPPTFVGTRDDVRARLWAEAIALGARVDLRGHGWSEPASTATAPFLPGGGTLGNQWNFLRQHGAVALGRKLWERVRPAPPETFDFSPYVKPMPVGDDYARVLRECTVCVGVNRYPSFRHPRRHPGTYSRLRDLEAPMVGACYLTEWTPELAELYDLGTEIETYRDAAELKARIDALQSDPARRRSLRRAGQRRALAEHTLPRTLERLARQLGCAPSP